MKITSREIEVGGGAVRELVCILAVQGRIDHAAVADFEQALAPHLNKCSDEGSRLVLDFAGVDYVSSVGLRALMLAARQVKVQNGRIAIAALTPMVSEIFRVSRFNLVFTVFENVETAVARLAKGGKP